MRRKRASLDITSPLIGQLVDKPTREEYVASQVRDSLPKQIRAMRRRRGLTQKVLAERAGTTALRISQMERASRHTLRIDTLLRLAAALDVGLEIRFVEFGDLIERGRRLDPEKFSPRPFDRELDDARSAAFDRALQPRRPRFADTAPPSPHEPEKPRAR